MGSILLTGGAGYIGSHTCVQLLEAGFSVVVLDDLSNSQPQVLDRIQRLAGRKPAFVLGDVRDSQLLDTVFQQHDIEAVIHFAGLKAVGESVAFPLRYYDCNINGTLTLCQTMQRHGVKNLVFSSSATVYGDPAELPLKETSPTGTTNPYGRSKLFIEQILMDLHASDPTWNIALLRYFNPVGAHPSGELGEHPQGIPNNLMPYIAQVAVGTRPFLQVFGNSYPTPDGTGVRDYLHVMDLAEGHLKALYWLRSGLGLKAFNLGRGEGYSVLDVLHAFEQACGKTLPYRIVDKRPGDAAACYADASLAHRELDWVARYDLDAMCRDAWNWQSRNPQGYN